MAGEPIAPYQGDEPFVFVSYSHQDSSAVHAELVQLREYGFNVWYDEGISPGLAWRDELARAIDRSGLFLFFVTRHSVNSDNCLKELNYALSRERPLLIVHLEPIDLPPGLALSLSDRQAIFKHELSSGAYARKITDAASRLLNTVPISAPTPKRAWRRVSTKLMVTAAVCVFAVAIVVAGGAWLLEQSTGTAIDSIAVLPFENGSDDPEGKYLSDGITIGLINSLSKLNGLRVVPRGIAFAYRDRDLDLRTIAEELGVRALVTGRISEIGDTLVIGAELVDAIRVEQLWGQQYHRKVADVLAVQKELVGAIIDHLALSLTPEELTRATDPATQNPEAYRLYLKSRYHALRITDDGLEKGVSYARAAIELDPDFALAHVALSQAQMTRAYLGRISWAEGGRISRAAAQRALELDDSLSEVHVELGFLAHHFDWDWLRAETAFRRAVELDPSNEEAWQGLSQALLSQGRVNESVVAATRAVEVDPLEPNVANWLGNSLRHARRYDEALSMIYQALEIEPDHMIARWAIPGLLLLMGRPGEAITAAQEVIKWSGGDPETNSWLAWMYAESGDADRARTILEKSNPVHGTASRAKALKATGEADAAFETLERLFDSRSNELLWFGTDPENDVFRDDPRYEDLVRRMRVAVGSQD